MGNTIGMRIREMRKVAGMSQEQLAEMLGTKKCTISAYENDKIDIKTSILLDIAEVLGCSASYLLEGQTATNQDADMEVQELKMLLDGMSPEMKKVVIEQARVLKGMMGK